MLLEAVSHVAVYRDSKVKGPDLSVCLPPDSLQLLSDQAVIYNVKFRPYIFQIMLTNTDLTKVEDQALGVFTLQHHFAKTSAVFQHL